MVWQAILGKVLGNVGKGPDEAEMQLQRYDAPEGAVSTSAPRVSGPLASSVMQGMEEEEPQPLPQAPKRRYY